MSFDIFLVSCRCSAKRFKNPFTGEIETDSQYEPLDADDLAAVPADAC